MTLDYFWTKTFGEDTYGRHALTQLGVPGDVVHLLNADAFHGTRLPCSYVPRHAAGLSDRLGDMVKAITIAELGGQP